jgi:hypothetical protein
MPPWLRFLAGDRPEPSTYFLSVWLFQRALAVVYLVAFASLGVQILGLVGSDGILPARDFLELVAQRIGLERYRLLPTLCWFGASDGLLRLLCGAGVGLSILLFFGVAPPLVLFMLWLFYLSLTAVGRDFLGFQWDALLLETGFLAIFLAPCRWLGWRAVGIPHARGARLLLWWLLFRLMLSSGAVKLLSGDASWRNLSALRYHYETQPLPTWIGWYAQLLSAWFQSLSCAVMFAVELLVPFAIFLPRRPRHAACVCIAALMLLIAVTGNYCFFNLLTLALCLLLVDDAAWPALWRERFAADGPASDAGGQWRAAVLRPTLGVLLALSCLQLGLTLWRGRVPEFVVALDRAIEPFHSVNRYGLFAVMTTSRPEIVVEGSDDGFAWKAYEFGYKPGDLHRRPRFVAPHQPRLDWQMWFAALGTYQENRWFTALCERLLEGKRPVLALLATNPFPDHPPRYVRALVYDYHFTDVETRRRDGTWWRREARGEYCPTLSLRGAVP